MHAPIAITAGSALLAQTPNKPRRFLEKALARGLSVVQTDTATGTASYSIASPNPVDDWRLWIHYTAGHNGGRLNLVRYTPNAPKGRPTTKKLTIMGANILIDDMGDSLDRHNARVAQAEAALRQVGRELDGTVVDVPASPRNAAVRELKATQPVLADETAAALLVAEAHEKLATLKVNGRFAIRMAKTGAIPRSTTGTVRQALLNRDLVTPAGGVLTDLGKAVRELILNPAS